ncbi:cGMP-dependent 3',5'-cyclic phosphodiesterase [Amphibalanus amphitrite]|uniref:Phosphodiesterase n=1 Tax=Amphibalanus amphitrite TaxID=1232801 RepID=A0A6A4WR41_AMPAM|nr:cGMP-dependent 3',5'-cyclic phosphodiesterase [Amphibalanus amphitrite]KAF0309757.1 cGMP-dependent 3',5'-cyclic phosphodiesterase [Amphibalanus amphitrite]
MAPQLTLEPARLLQLVVSINTHDPIKIQCKVNQFLREETGASAVFCVIYCRDREDLFCQVVNQTTLPLEERLPADHPLLGGALRSPSPLFLPGVRLSELSSAVAAAAGADSDSDSDSGGGLLVVSASWGDATQPGLLVCLAGRAAPFAMEDALLVRHVLGHVFGTLMHAVTSAEAQRVQLQCRSLLRVAQSIFRHIGDVTVLLRDIMTQARNLTGAERCSLFLVDKRTNELVAKVFDVADDAEQIEEIRLPMVTGIVGSVAASGELLNIRDAYAHPLFYRQMDENTGFRTRNILCFPIKDEKEVLGVAELCNKVTGPHFTRFDEEAARAFAIYCGIALVNSFMYRKIMDTQERVQLSNELMMYHMQVSREETDQLCAENTGSVARYSPSFTAWEYFPRDLEERRWPAAVLAMYEDLGLVHRFGIERSTLARFVLMVRKGYRDPPYHNFSHAYSVAHFAYLMLKNLQLVESRCLDDLESLSLLTACLCHDLDHRGTTNSFQVASRSVLASLYSSEGSVMEQHHFAQSVCILNTDGCNILSELPPKDYTQCLDMVRGMILATDLSRHLSIMTELEAMATGGYRSCEPRHRRLLHSLLMTAADLSDQTKRWLSSKKAAKLVYREFFSQGDMEKQMGNDPSEMMDRERAFIPKLQIQFLDDIALPVYSLMGSLFPACEEVYAQTKANRRCWQRMADICSRRNATNVQSIDVFDNERLDEEVLASDGESNSVQCATAPPGGSTVANSRLSSLRPYVSGVLPCCVSKNEVME